MAITDVAAYAHLSDADLEAFAIELDAIRRDIEASRGEKDSTYIRRAIVFQRFLDVAARLSNGCHHVVHEPLPSWRTGPVAGRRWKEAASRNQKFCHIN